MIIWSTSNFLPDRPFSPLRTVYLGPRMMIIPQLMKINHFLSIDVDDEQSKLVEYNLIEEVLGRFGLAEDFRLLESRFFTDSVIDLASS